MSPQAVDNRPASALRSQRYVTGGAKKYACGDGMDDIHSLRYVRIYTVTDSVERRLALLSLYSSSVAKRVLATEISVLGKQ